MTTPKKSTLDRRFSDPESTATSWDAAQRELESAQLFWITTVRPDGRPHTAPLVAVWHAGALYFCTGAAEQKGRNLETNTQVSLLTGANSWDSGLDVVLEGEAVRVTEQPLLEQLAAVWATKWDGQWQYTPADGVFEQTGGGEALVFEVRPAKVLAFGKGAFSQTTHEF